MTAPWPTAATRLTGLLGWPARYSLSPVLHNAAFRAAGHDVAYLVFPCVPERLDAAIDGLAAVGTLGVNVTIPHKQAAVASCSELSEEAQLVGVVNTLTFADGIVHGDNTDATGLLAAWRQDEVVSSGDRVVLFGTGGAARAAAVAAGRCGAFCTIIGRRAPAVVKLTELAQRAGSAGATGVQVDDANAVAECVAHAQVVVNATPQGMDGESLPAPMMSLDSNQIAYDLVYTPLQTAFLAAAQATGARTYNGVPMLVHQAAQAWLRWMGHPPDYAAMQSALDRALTSQL